jgi:hypothetical protein
MSPSQVHLLSMVDRLAVLTRNELWREVVPVPASRDQLIHVGSQACFWLLGSAGRRDRWRRQEIQYRPLRPAAPLVGVEEGGRIKTAIL